MKLVSQKLLAYQQGSSDKVYEVDLCEVGADRFVVNYRYGRRGARLKEGTETEGALPLAAAQRVFDKLVASKLQKGYTEVPRPALGSPPPTAPVMPAAPPAQEAPGEAPRAVVVDRQAMAVLMRLQRGLLEAAAPPPPPPRAGRQAQRRTANQPRPAWPLERALWRAGELALPDATPLLLRFLQLHPAGGGQGAQAAQVDLRRYCAAWSLGRCAQGEHTAQAAAALQALSQDPSASEPLRRVATDSRWLLADESERAALTRAEIDRLPAELAVPLRQGSEAALHAALQSHLTTAVDQRYDVLESLYRIGGEPVRAVVLDALRTMPLQPGPFRRLRHIYKSAEQRRDAEVLGILGHRFEKAAPRFRRRDGGGSDRLITADGKPLRREDVPVLTRGPGATLAFSATTRDYLRRRVWRTLRRLGERADLDYVNLAVGVLLPFTDADAVPVKERVTYDHRARRRDHRYWDQFAPYYAFNFVLYGRGARYQPTRSGKTWRCTGGYKPGGAEPTAREESYPHLWEGRPAGLLHLLAESRCLAVHRFAVKTLRSLRALCATLEGDTLIVLLASPYDITAELGFELTAAYISAHLRPRAADLPLVLAAAQSCHAPARTAAHRWIDEDRDLFLADGDFVLALCVSPHGDTRAFARRLLAAVDLSPARAQVLISRIIAYLLSLGAGQEATAADIAELLQASFPAPLRGIGMAVLGDLLRHPLPQVQELGAALVLRHDIVTRAPGSLPDEVLELLLASPFAAVRGAGMRLLALLDDAALLTHEGLLRELATHREVDIRGAARPLLRRLVQAHPALGARLCAALLDVLCQREPETHPGLHRALLRELQEDLASALGAMTPDIALRLVASPSPLGQELGGQLLRARPAWADGMDTATVVKLASHEVQVVREAALALFTRIVPRLRGSVAEMTRGVRLLDAKWEDARAAAFRLLRDAFTAAHWTPELLVAVCDSVLPDVQQFGRELITRFFHEDDGQSYMLRLAEHPSVELQLFVTNYLERYAAGDLARLRALAPYFVGVLSRVNRGGVAKRRVLAFVQGEALRSEEAARLFGDLLTRQVLTAAITDRARIIEALALIHRAYPQVALPLRVKVPPLRGPAGDAAQEGRRAV